VTKLTKYVIKRRRTIVVRRLVATSVTWQPDWADTDTLGGGNTDTRGGGTQTCVVGGHRHAWSGDTDTREGGDTDIRGGGLWTRVVGGQGDVWWVETDARGGGGRRGRDVVVHGWWRGGWKWTRVVVWWADTDARGGLVADTDSCGEVGGHGQAWWCGGQTRLVATSDDVAPGFSRWQTDGSGGAYLASKNEDDERRICRSSSGCHVDVAP
jgi:hypothetical protein